MANNKSEETPGYWTWRLFRDGYSESEVLAILCSEPTELVDQLVLAARGGLSVDPTWVADNTAAKRIRSVLKGSAVGG